MWNKLFGVSPRDLSVMLSSTKIIHLYIEMFVPVHYTVLYSYFIFINIHLGHFHANVINSGLSSVNKLLKYKSHLVGYYSF